MNEDLNSLYQSVSNQFNIGTFEEFSAKMQTIEQRKNFFDGISTKIDIGRYEEFESRLGASSEKSYELDITPETEIPMIDSTVDQKTTQSQSEDDSFDIIDVISSFPLAKAKAVYDFIGHVTDDYEYEAEETNREKSSYHKIKKALKYSPLAGGMFGGSSNNPLTNLFAEGISAMGRAGGSGVRQGKTTQPGWVVMSAGQDVTTEQAQGLIDVNNQNQNNEQTDAIRGYQERYDQLEEEHGGVMAFMVAAAENPMYLRDVSVQSLAMMATALLTSPAVAKRAIPAAAGGAVLGSVAPIIGTGLGALSALMGTVSGTMDAGLSYQQFLQEQLAEDGKDFTAENVVNLLQDDRVETYEDPNGLSFMDITGTKEEIIKQRSIQRGWGIGLVDGLTGILAGGVGRGRIFTKGARITTKSTKVTTGTAIAIGGGVASEISGQTFGRQEYDMGQILTEGFAEKGMVTSGVTVLPQLIKKKGTYKIIDKNGNAEIFTEKRFVREVNAMNDMTLAMANIEIENDAALNRQLGLRQQNAIMDSQVDAKVYDTADRKILVEKQKQLEKAKAEANKKGSYAVAGADVKVEKIEAEIKAIIDKYASTDGRKKEVRDRAKIKQLVGETRDRILLQETEKFAESGGKKLDLNPYQAFTNTDKFVKGVVDHLMKQKIYNFDGKRVDISKLSDKKIAEEIQRIEKSSRKRAGAAILTDTNGKDTIFINREAAVKYRQLDVGSHEILHKVLKGAITNMKPEARKKMINEFKQEIETNLGGNVLKAIETNLKEAYGNTIDINTTDEWFTALSDVIESKENNITYDNSKSFFDNLKDMIPAVFKKETDYNNLSIKDGAQAFEFMKEYSQNVKKGELSERMVAFAKTKGFAKGEKIPPKDKEAGVAFSKSNMQGVLEEYQATKENKGSKKIRVMINEMLSKTPQGEAVTDITKSRFAQEVGPIVETIAKRLYDKIPADALRAANLTREDYKNALITEAASMVQREYDPALQNLDKFISSRLNLRANSMATDLGVPQQIMKDVESRSKEGEVKIQVAAEKSTEMEVFEEEDLSIQGQAKKDKAKKERYSKLRQEMGFKREVLDEKGKVVEEGDKIHKEILDDAIKTLLLEYSKVQNIEDAGSRAQIVANKMKKQYANLNSPFFKQIKNFLTYGIASSKKIRGEKVIYLSQLKKFREAIAENISTADFVQIHRNDAQADKVFLNFVKTVTKIDEVKALIKQQRLDPSALNTITKDEKTGKGSNSVPLYDKTLPSETELISWADQPLINPVTGLRSGLKGTRKDGITMRLTNSLVTDATMEAEQSDKFQDALRSLNLEMLVKNKKITLQEKNEYLLSLSEADLAQASNMTVAEIKEQKRKKALKEKVEKARQDLSTENTLALSVEIGREVNVKFSKSNAIGDISAAMNGTGSVNVYSQIKFSKAHRDAYEKQLTKRRPDLTEKQRKNAVQSVFDFVDGKDIPNHLKSKYEKMAMHYTANGFLILPEDGYKVIEAERLATIKKLDPFSFKNPNVLIEKYVDQVKGTRTNPDNVKTFTNKTQLTNGVTVYDVEDSKQGQIDSRKVIDTHFGKKANPWCLLANDSGGYYSSDQALSLKEAKEKVEEQEAVGRTATITGPFISKGVKEWEITIMKKVDPNDKLKGAFEMWKSYNSGGNGFKIAFQNGKLIAFRDGSKFKQWWDRMDQSSKGIMIKGKKAADGFTPTIELNGSKETITGYEKGTSAWQQDNGSYIRKDLDGNLVESHTKVNGKFIGERISPGSEGAVTIDTFKDGKIVKRVQDSTKEMQLFKNGYDVGIGADKITVGNLTKWQSTTTGDNVSLMDGQDKKVEVIEGTVMQKESKDSQEGYDRYRGMQGEKVRIVRTRIGPDTGNYLDFSSVTINGVEQDIRVKFSKSVVKFSKQVALDVMLSQKQDKKLLPFIRKTIKTIGKKEQLSIEEKTILNVLQPAKLLVEQGHRLEEVFAVLMNTYDANLVKDIVQFGTIKKIRNLINDYHMPRIRIEGSLAMGKIYKNDFKKATSKKEKMRLVDEYAKMIGISERNGQGLSNQAFMDQTLYLVFDKKFIDNNYKLEENSYGGKSLAYKNGEFVPMFHSIKDIKNNSRSKPDLVEKVNLEAAEAIGYVQRIINTPESVLSMADKIAIIDLLSLDQRGVIRKMYKLGVGLNNSAKAQKYKVGKTEDADGGNITLEHRITAADMTLYIQERIKGRLSEAKLSEIIEQATVHVLPRKYKGIDLNKTLDAAGYKITGGKNRYSVLEKYFDLLLEKQEGQDGGLIDIKPPNLTPVDISKLGSIIQFSRSANNPTKGITVLDFDDTLATSKSLIKFTRPDGTKGTLNAEQYASTYEDLSNLGYKFDFSEFTKVVDGKTAPLFNKAMKLQGKFGPESMFVLTARPMESAGAIHAFLKANGLNIPLKNITGLANSTAEAKALWVAGKVGEGYNDFYFADDALQNVKAVKNMLDQFDVKSKVQQAKVKFSKSMDKNFNDILENVTGIESKKRFSAIKARKRGENKGKFRFFIPPSHEDFVGLLYNFMGKGKEGNAHRDFWEKSLVRPLNRAYRELNTAKQSIANDYKSLNKQFEDVKNKLTKKTPDGDFTYQDAIRVYLWNKHGHTIPGLSKTDQTKLSELVMSDPSLQTYAETLNVISKQEAYVKPTESWEAGDIRVDLDDATGRVGRGQFFTEFNENSEIIFSEENFNKIEAAYGANVVSAIKDILYRTKTGRNRPSGQNELTNKFMNYLNGSVGATMFFNIRSMVLQQMSMVNFINFADNNIFSAAKAFANQPQYYKDWAYIFNSDFMKQRRGGIKTDVNGAELAASLKGNKNTPAALLAKLLELGFLPTQIGDNVAIATGGATFYRNRINTYKKQGLSQKEAETKAWTDFEALAEATQQSARPDMVSQQQASPLGKIILAFQNVTSQFNRIGKKAFLDIKNRRITPGNTTQLQSDVSNLSRISYYFAIQNLIFYSLQSALFMAMFGDDEEDDKFLKKKERIINGSIDSVLRGTGVWGAIVATLKNMAIKNHEQREKKYNPDESSVIMEMLNVSPPLGIKVRKMVNAEKTLNYNKKVIDEMETFDIDNPMWSAYTNRIEAITNVPVNRLYNKTQNVRQSLNNQHSAFLRALMFSGWSQYNLDIENERIDKIKQDIKDKKKKSSKKKTKGRKATKRKTVFR